MKRLFAVTMLSLIYFPARAEWVLVSWAADGGFRNYVDFDTVRRTGNTVKVWFLREYARAGYEPGASKPHLSAKLMYEYNCKDNTLRLLSGTLYEGRQGAGSPVFALRPGQWEYAVLGSVDERQMNVACGYRP